MRVSLLTGGADPNYAIPLATALADREIHVEFIGNDHMKHATSLQRTNIQYLNLRGNQDPQAPVHHKVARLLRYYRNLVAYTCTTESNLFHILWLNKFDLLDRILLTAFYKFRRKKLVFTAHNVNTRKRDGNDTWTNTTTLRLMYSMVDHIFVHTERSREELLHDYRVKPDKVSVIPFGLNTYVPETSLSKTEARSFLGLGEVQRVLLFFGQIAPYKGLDILIEALKILCSRQQAAYLLIIAGRAKPGTERYWHILKSALERDHTHLRILVKDTFVPDRTVPILFRAADALVLPYRAIYQSGPLSLAYRFGVPVIATRVGSFDREVIPDVTGLLCEPENPHDLARAIGQYFESGLCFDGNQTQKRIMEIGAEKYSWDLISRKIAAVYARL